MTMAPERLVEVETDNLFQDESLLALEGLQTEVHERHFCNIELKSHELNGLILFSQIRDKKNQRFAELEESIDNDDLDNPINIARMTVTELEAYIKFTNKTWKAATTLSDFETYVQPDGRYNVVVAGHSRTLSIKNIARKHTQMTGQPTNYTVLCKIEKDNSVEAIVGKQFLENIHAPVPPHREAEAVVEMYHQGLGDKWNTPEEFRATCKNVVSVVVLNKALAYGELFQQARDMVVAGTMRYSVAVELGKLAQVLRVHSALEHGLDATETLPEELEKKLAYDVMADCARRFREGFTQTAAIKEIDKALHEKLEAIQDITGIKVASNEDLLRSILQTSVIEKARAKKKSAEDVPFDLENFMFSEEDQYQMDMNEAHKKYTREARAVLSGQLEKSAKFIGSMLMEGKQDPRIEQVIEDAASALEVFTTEWSHTPDTLDSVVIQTEVGTRRLRVV